jgi:hypothetical protein
MDQPPKKQSPLRWYTLGDAAELLSLSVDALRRQIERRAHRAPDGGTEADIDSVRARKFGHLWRVSFGQRWVE